MKMKKITKYFKPIVLSGILLVSVGCTDSNEKSESVQNIRAILQEEFNGPSDELEDGFEEPSELNDYYDENLKPHFSERVYKDYTLSYASEFLEVASEEGYELKVEDITIEESENTKNSYNFTVVTKYTKEGSNDSKTIKVKGLANTNQDGKIERLLYHNYSEFKDTLGK